MTIALSRTVQYVQYVAPFIVTWLSFVAALLIVWRATVYMMDRKHERWMHLYGDAALKEKIQSLQRRLLARETDLRVLERKNKELLARIRAGIQQSAKVSEILTRESE